VAYSKVSIHKAAINFTAFPAPFCSLFSVEKKRFKKVIWVRAKTYFCTLFPNIYSSPEDSWAEKDNLIFGLYGGHLAHLECSSLGQDIGKESAGLAQAFADGTASSNSFTFCDRYIFSDIPYHTTSLSAIKHGLGLRGCVSTVTIARGPAGHPSAGGRWWVIAFASLFLFFCCYTWPTFFPCFSSSDCPPVLLWGV